MADATDEALVKQGWELLRAYGQTGEGLGDAEALAALDEAVELDSGEDLGRRKVNCLHWAAERGYETLLRHLLGVGNNAEGVTEAFEGATPLHLALMRGRAACVALLCEENSDVNAMYEAQPCLHLAVALARFPSTQAASAAMLSSLLAANADVSALDAEGCTALHRAASAGSASAVRALVGAGAAAAQQDYGLATPLHYACMALGVGGGECAAALLEGYSEEDTGRESAVYGTALELATAMGSTEAAAAITTKFPPLKPPPTTPPKPALVLHSAACGLHAPKAEYGPECAERLEVLLGEGGAGGVPGVLRGAEFGGLKWEHVTRHADMASVLRVHEYNYVRRLQALCEGLPETGVHRLDLDTAITSQSYSAALCAAAAVVRAVDAVCDGECGAAFCCTRPAGHHAGPSGASTCFMEAGKKGDSHGFCLFSNVALGAAHALATRARDSVQRVAIVDFDVHHGNGTEECVRNLVPHQVSSTMETPMGEATFKAWSYKPWRDDKDADNVLFVSTHAHGDIQEADNARYASGASYTGMFYPGTGPEDAEGEGGGGVLNVPLGPRFGSREFRGAFERVVLPRLAAFKPDLIVISAGFDAHKQDSMNYGLVALSEDDYFWATDRLRAIATLFRHSRVVSVLEGGYRVNGGASSALARSVAAHVRAMAKAPPAAYVPGGGGAERVEAVMDAMEAHRQQLAEGGGGGGRRKRRRAAVDYAALDAKMRE